MRHSYLQHKQFRVFFDIARKINNSGLIHKCCLYQFKPCQFTCHPAAAPSSGMGDGGKDGGWGGREMMIVFWPSIQILGNTLLNTM